MDVSRSADKLRHAFDRLFTQTRHRVQDDTLLEKLRDLLRWTLSADICTSICEAKRNDTLMVLESVPWIPSLTENHQMLNPHVTAFGLAVIGDMAAVAACRRTLMMNADDIRKFLKDIMGRYVKSHACVRCALIVTLRSFWTSNGNGLRNTVLSDIDISKVVQDGLTDSSIFVAREAKRLSVDYLSEALNSQEGRTAERVAGFVHFLISLVRKTDGKLDRNVVIALEVFLGVIERDSSIAGILGRKPTELKMAAMDCLVNSDNEAVCNMCSSVFVSLITCSFETGIPTEWMTVLDMLLATKPLVIAATFITTTCEKVRMDNILPIAVQLTSLLIEPIAISFDWTITEDSQKSKWWKPLREQCSGQAEHLKLCSYILVAVVKLLGFLSDENKVDFIKMLTAAQIDTDNLLKLSPRIQTSVLTCLISSLDEMCKKNESNALLSSVEDQMEIWRKALEAAEQPSLSTLVSTKRLQLIRKLLRVMDKGLENTWAEVGPRLCRVLQKRCHDVTWEIRDSAIEAIGEIILKAKDHPFLSNWCSNSGFIKVLIACMDDVESYVKANSLQVLSIIPSASKDLYSEASNQLPLGRLVSILLTDDDSVVRRAAAKALMSWTFASEHRISMSTYVFKTFLIASADLDWEVKLACVDFWDTTLSNAIGVNSRDKLLDHLLEIGFCDAMTQLTTDEDVSVRYKIAKLVQRLKELPAMQQHLAALPETNEQDIQSEEPQMAATTTVECMTDEAKYAAIDKVLDTIDSNLVNEAMLPPSELPTFSISIVPMSDNDAKLDHLISSHHRFHPARMATREFLSWLHQFDLDALLKQRETSTDIYDCNPDDLIDDLLVAHEESETEMDIALDCY